jgi:chemotaxis protein MotB
MANSSNRVWISVSDMMTGLMMVFLFISIVFMEKVDTEKKSIENIALTYKSYQEEMYQSLIKEFDNDLVGWDATILPDSTIRFKEPDVLFDEGSKEIKPRFQGILLEFFPRYISVLASNKYRDNIEEVRIEGHTSSNWEGSKTLEDRYLNNALLSQQRSFVILEYCFKLPQTDEQRTWLTKVLRANGLAFARPIVVAGLEDASQSRRVEFKVKTKADEKIRDILKTLKKSDRAEIG